VARQRWRFLVVFLLLVVAFEVVLFLEPVDRNLVQPFTRGITAVSGAILSALAQPVSVAGTVITSSCFSVNINNGCNGVEASLFLGAAVLAFPAAWRSRLMALAGGLALIQVLNLVRIVALWMTGCYRREWFEASHLAIWQTIVFAATTLFFVFWTRNTTVPHVAPRT
jgi:exosortase H (IPTLxxWG-CTERM-specific)